MCIYVVCFAFDFVKKYQVVLYSFSFLNTKISDETHPSVGRCLLGRPALAPKKAGHR